MVSMIDFVQFVPVMHQPTAGFFAYLTAENKDFDSATENETYLCYPLHQNGFLNAEAPQVFCKKELQPVRNLH